MKTTNTPRTEAATVHNAELSDWGAGDSNYCYKDQMEQLELDYNKLKQDCALMRKFLLKLGVAEWQIDALITL